jgi:hypothetical protein
VPGSYALFCLDEEACSDISIGMMETAEFESPVDVFQKRSICVSNNVLNEDDIMDENEKDQGDDCTIFCDGYELALIRPDACYCGPTTMLKGVSVTLALNTSCSVCISESAEDPEDPFKCGSLFGDTVFLSAYQLGEDTFNHGFKYWQCVHTDLFNDPANVLPKEQYEVVDLENASGCLEQCRKLSYNTTLMTASERDDELRCTCLPDTYKFRMEDLDSRVSAR